MTAITTARAAALALSLALVGAAVPTLAADTPAPSATQPPAPGPATVKIPARYDFYLHKKLPKPYAGKTNPLKVATVPAVIRGADIYNAKCASCHGLMGFGNGAAGSGLKPKPADLAWSLSGPVKDDFLYWTIAEGGAQFGSNMPAFKGELQEHQIWDLITYMRAAFEGREARAVPALSATKQAMASTKPHS